MLYHFQVIWRSIIVTLKRSLRIIQTDTIRKPECGFLFAFHSNNGRIFNHLWDIQRQSIVNLENWVRGCSRSLKMAPFDRPHTTFYWSDIVNYSSIWYRFELCDVEWYHDLEIWIRGHSRSFRPVPIESLSVISYSPSIVIITLSCIICEIKQDIGRKSWFFIPLAFGAPVKGVPVGMLPSRWYWKTRMVGLPDGQKNFEDMCNRLDYMDSSKSKSLPVHSLLAAAAPNLSDSGR